jgi:tetratricopeptide (TPR) repeat protein
LRLGTIVLALALSAPAHAALTEPARVGAIYDLILDARFDRAAARLKETCPPVPAPVCQAVAAASLWWRVQINPEEQTFDAALNAAARDAIAAAEQWTRREPQRGEAWFYVGASYGPLVNLRVLRGQRLAAAREGKTIKDALERALQLDPSIDDAYFGIGLYHYYADVAPAYARLLRWLLLLPGGNRVAGLQEMLRARERAAIFRGEADLQLALVYLWYERRPPEAIAILESLDARYPFNPFFLERIADARAVQLRDRDGSAAAWSRLRDRARSGATFDAARVARRAEEKLRAINGRNF